jgi:hypothetical protein
MVFAVQTTLDPIEAPRARIESQASDIAPRETAPLAPIPFFPSRSETLSYDNGTFSAGLGIQGGPSTPGADTTIGFATYFVLSEFGITDPRKVGAVRVQFSDISGTSYRLYVWDNQGATLMPNSHGTHLYVDMGVALPAPDVWQEIDLSAQNIVLPDTFWIGIIYNELTVPSDWYLAREPAIPDTHTYASLSGIAGDWTPLANFGFGDVFAVNVIVEPVGGPTPTVYDFETGPQGWVNTNGQPFPAGWGVEPAGLHGGTWQLPASGDSSMWIDSDAAGSATWVQDTALSPVLVPDPAMDWLVYGVSYNWISTGEWLEVGIKYFDGGNWTAVPLATYTGDTGPMWDSVDVSAYSGYAQVQVYFYYDDDDIWAWYAAFDNVTIDAGAGGPMVYDWDFETGEQGWTHTNGGTFPAAWDVVSSSYTVSSYTIAPPDAGDSSFCADGDNGGIFHDTAMSPVVDNPGFTYFKWGMHFQNYVSYQTFTVIMRTFSSGAWNPWTDVWTYTVDTSPQYDSVDISATVSDSVQVGFVYDQPHATLAWFAAFDNVELIPALAHDVGCAAVVSPPEGSTAPADYDVIGEIWNYGSSDETFDVVANVYDTVGMVNIFTQTINLTLTAGADTNLDFGQVTFGSDMYFYTEIYTMLAGDADPSNDTSAIYSWTALGLGDVVFELDAQGACNDNQLLGIEFDGERFYITGGGNAADPNKVYVVDTMGTLLWSLDQPAHSTGWGWRDVAWDDVYVGPDRIDTLYASVDPNVDYFSIDLTGGNLVYHGATPGAQSPNRALAYYPDSGWFFTANFSSDCYKFNKAGVILQNVPNTYAMYGSAFDGDWTGGGPHVWWHSQDDPGTGFNCQISQMDPYTMSWVGSPFGFALPAALTDAIAGGLCFYSGFRGMDVLFALLQGTPNDYVVGIYVRPGPTGISGKPGVEQPLVFGFAPSMATVTKGHMPISYSTTMPGHVSLKVYDNMGRLVQTLVNTHQTAGEKSVYWNNKDVNNRTISNGVYFLKLEVEGETAVQKLILVK